METIQIKDPAIADVIVSSTGTEITFLTSDGLKQFNITPDSEQLSFSIGDTTSLGYGGTDNWGKDVWPITLEYKQGSREGDSVFVDTIEIQEQSDWCRCEVINSGGALLYTALTENPSKEPRTVYFIHRTKDTTIKRGYAAGRPAASSWYVTVVQDGNPNAEPEPKPEERISFDELINQFNDVLSSRGKNTITETSKIYSYLKSAYERTDLEWTSPKYSLTNKDILKTIEVYDYHGDDTSYSTEAYNSLQGWLFAMFLSEIVPDSGSVTNTQTELFRKAYSLGGGTEVPLFGLEPHADPMIARLVAGLIYSEMHDSADIESFRKELGGSAIQASSWNSLGYSNTMLSDEYGRRGYRMDKLGYIVNSEVFLPDAPAPRITGTTVCELSWPFDEGQSKDWFNPDTNNYKQDEICYNNMVSSWNMMSQTPLDEWNSYPIEKQNRLVNVMTTIPCTYNYFFGRPKNVHFDGIQHCTFDGDTYADYYIFSETNEETGLKINGPFSDLAGLYRYNVPDANKNAYEKFVEAVTDIADNSRFPTMDPNYGRCRPGCSATRAGGERVPVHGAPQNELFNNTLIAMVADDEAGRTKALTCDGFAQDSPRSYVSGHSAQVFALAMILGQMDPSRLDKYSMNAISYSENRVIARFHWLSDVIYGRLFATLSTPLINAMSGLKSGYNATKQFVTGETPQGDWNVRLYIKNMTGRPIQSTGEIRLYVDNHIGINTYLPGACVTAGALYTFAPGDNDFSLLDVHCVMNGEDYMDDSYNGSSINDARFYDYRHWNNIDAGYKFSLDTSDSRCDTVLKKSGATYVLKIETI